MKRFLLSALGTLGVAGLTMAQPPASSQPTMPKADGSAPAPAPAMLQHQPAPLEHGVIVNGNGNGNGNGHYYENGYSEDCGRGGLGLIGGFELLYLRPHFEANPALSITQTDVVVSGINGAAGAPAGVTGTTTTSRTGVPEFQYDWSLSPRIWLGVQGENGVGFRGRWFHFDQSADPIAAIGRATGRAAGAAGLAPLPAGRSTTAVGSIIGGINAQTGGVDTRSNQILPANDTIVATTSLFMDVWDAEFVASGSVGGMDITGAAGVRYAFIEQTYNVYHPGVTTSTIADIGAGGPIVTASTFVQDTLLSRQTFTGAGPTLALGLSRGMGGLSVFANTRGSILFGRGHQEINNSQLSRAFTRAPVAGIQETVNRANARTDVGGWDVLPVLEVEVGAQFGMGMGGANLFVRPALTGQVWYDGGSGSSLSGNFGLIGASITAGIGF